MAREQWRTEAYDAYDPDKLHMHASDKQGHSATLRLNVPKTYSGAIASVVNSPNFAYRTTHDFVRDAIYHRLHWASGKQAEEGYQSGGYGFLKMKQSLAENRALGEDWKEFDTELDEVVMEARMHGDMDRLRDLLHGLEGQARTDLVEPFLTKALDKIELVLKRL